MDSPTYREHFTEEQCIAMAADGHYYVDQFSDGKYTYFAGLNCDGLVKIGFTSNPRQRLLALRHHHGKDIEMFALRKGGRRREEAYHVQFAYYRVHGEWFEPSPRIVQEIVRLRKHSASIPSLDRRAMTNDITRLLGALNHAM